MVKTHTRFVCQECGRAAASYMGKCPQCGSFNSMMEEVVHDQPPVKGRVEQPRFLARHVHMLKVRAVRGKAAIRPARMGSRRNHDFKSKFVSLAKV